MIKERNPLGIWEKQYKTCQRFHYKHSGKFVTKWRESSKPQTRIIENFGCLLHVHFIFVANSCSSLITYLYRSLSPFPSSFLMWLPTLTNESHSSQKSKHFPDKNFKLFKGQSWKWRKIEDEEMEEKVGWLLCRWFGLCIEVKNSKKEKAKRVNSGFQKAHTLILALYCFCDGHCECAGHEQATRVLWVSV